MHRKTFWLRSVWALPLNLLVWGLAAFAAEPAIRVVSPASASPVDIVADGAELGIQEILQRGERLEEDRRWGEAVSLYEDALRNFPAVVELTSRHDLARLHYDLSRRYSDDSFLRAVSALDEREAMAIYAEVLLKIQSHYVQEPRWQALIDRGTKSLSLALNEEPFVKRHLAGRNPDRIEAFKKSLRQFGQNKRINSRQQTIDAAGQAVRLAREHLNLSPAAVALEYACGAGGGLDEYSSYLTSDQLNDVYSQIDGNFVGLGIELKAADGGLQIVKVISGSPAEKGGVRAGERIVMVDGRSTRELSTDQAANLLQGKEGSWVEVTLATPPGNERKVRLRRENVDVPSIDEERIVDPDYGVAFVRLTCFQKTTSRDLDASLWRLHRQGMRSLIIDLRRNPGGLLTSSVEIADKFLEEGVIVSTRGRSALEDFNYSAHRAGTWRVPLVVLIDADSASASEIFAGAIRDHRRGTIVGQKSYGKGTVQAIFPLATAGAGLRLTTARFYSPSGRPISHVGIQPDIVVAATAKPIDGSLAVARDLLDDAFVQAAIRAARNQTAQR